MTAERLAQIEKLLPRGNQTWLLGSGWVVRIALELLAEVKRTRLSIA